MFDAGDNGGTRRGGSLLSVRAYQPGGSRGSGAENDKGPLRAGNDSAPLGGTLMASRSGGRKTSPAAGDAGRMAHGGTRPRAGPPRNGGDDSDEWRPLIDPAQLLSTVWRARYLIAATTLAGGIAAALVALSIPKLYYSSAELLIDPRDLKLVERELTPSNIPFDATLAIVENQMRIMTSRAVTSKVIEQMGLDADPEFNGTEPPRGVIGFIGELFALGGDSDPAVLRVRAMETLWDRLSVDRAEKSFVVNVTAASQDPQKAADIANRVTSSYIAFQEKLQAGTANTASGELSSRLGELGDKVRESERAVEKFRAENDLLDAQGRLIGDEELLRLNDQLSGARAGTIALNARAASVSRLTADDVVSGTLPEQVNSTILADLRGQHAALKQQRDALAIKLGPRHPDRLALDSQIESARQEIVAEVRRINSSIQVELKRAVQTEQDLAARLAQVKARQSASKGDLVRLRELERQAAADRAIYEAYLLRARETGEQSNISTANISVISDAEPALEPQGMSRKLITAGGLAAGFAAGILLALLMAMIRSLGGAPSSPAPSSPPPPPAGPRGTPPRDRGHQWYRRRNPDTATPYVERPAPPPERPGGHVARLAAMVKSLQESIAARKANRSTSRDDIAPEPPAPSPAPAAHQAPPLPQGAPAHPLPAAYGPMAQPAYPQPIAMAMPQPVYMTQPPLYPYPYSAPAPQGAMPQHPPVTSETDRRIDDLRATLEDMRLAVSDIARARRRA